MLNQSREHCLRWSPHIVFSLFLLHSGVSWIKGQDYRRTAQWSPAAGGDKSWSLYQQRVFKQDLRSSRKDWFPLSWGGVIVLIKCKECGHEVSDQAQACPYCGAPVLVRESVAASYERTATILCLICITGCLLGTFSSWAYGLYVLLRILVCGTSAFLAWCSAEQKWTKWVWVLGITAIVFNPILPFPFGRSLWEILDLACGVVLAVWLIWRARSAKSRFQ